MKFLLFLLLLLCAPCWAQTDTLRLLCVGNSFSMNAVDQNLYEIAREAGHELIIGNLYVGGCTLRQHADFLRRDTAIYQYRKVVGGQLTPTPHTRLTTAASDEPWDVVSLQQGSGSSGLPATYEPHLTYLLDTLRQLIPTPHLRFVWHMTWAYASTYRNKQFAVYGYSQPRMYDDICHTVDSLILQRHADDFDVVIPVGTAVQLARATSLGDRLCQDGLHLQRDYGRYLAALVWAQSLFHIDPRNVRYQPEGVTPQQAYLVKQAAYKAAH